MVYVSVDVGVESSAFGDAADIQLAPGMDAAFDARNDEA